MQLGTRYECVGSLLRVLRVSQDSTREFARRGPRLVRRLSRVAEKLARSYDDLVMDVCLSIRSGFERCSEISLEFARRFAEGIGKLARNMSGDCRKKTIRLVARMPESTGFAGVGYLD
ncbi:hypothetical protein B296_00018983 [Ensete ventricosum]|uniref:Uncharacterized protein n=1 Tax=Ensete ventricosum TaxID=4639 RepID=A0A426ZIC4_ENSVE|nr:hypothetical protein B296_00018983 [Ensete ventricosum]